MPRDWRCRIGWHDRHEVQMPDHDKCAQCTRCGNRDWRRLLRRVAGEYHREGEAPCEGAAGWVDAL
jgi:hypothetical protein